MYMYITCVLLLWYKCIEHYYVIPLDKYVRDVLIMLCLLPSQVIPVPTMDTGAEVAQRFFKELTDIQVYVHVYSSLG